MIKLLNEEKRIELYKNDIFVKNHLDCLDELFETFHELRNGNPNPKVKIWLEAVKEIEKYFVFTSEEKRIFYIVAENYYYSIEVLLEDYPLDKSPEFHCRCENFVCWFDTYLNQEELKGDL